jgi:hypothetical protein
LSIKRLLSLSSNNQTKMAVTKKKSAKIKASSFSRFSLLVFVLVFAGIGAYILLKSNAVAPPASPSLYLTPDSQTLSVGDTFTVNVYEDSGTDTVNVVQANLTYPTSLLSYISYTNASAFTLAAENPTGDNGNLHFARATCGGCSPVSGVNQIVSVTFKAISAGSAPVNFGSGTMLVRSSDSQAESPLNEGPGSYTINGAATPPPTTPPPTNPPPSGGGTTTPPSSTTHTSTTTTRSTSSTPTTSTPTTTPTATTPTPTSSQNIDTGTSTPTASTNDYGLPANSAHILSVGATAAAVALVLTGLFWILQHVHLRSGFGNASSHVYMPTPAPRVSPLPPQVLTAPAAPAKPAAVTHQIPIIEKPAVISAKIVSPSKAAQQAITKANIPKKA